MEKYLVYKHTNTFNNKAYIGITKNIDNPNKRWRNGYGYIQNDKFFSDILKYGWNNFQHDILETDLNIVDASKKECYYIELYDTINSGYNISKGGNIVSNEGLKKISQALVGVPKTQESIDKQIETRKERYGNEKGINYLGTQSKKVKCKETQDVFISINDAERWCGSNKVSECCQGKRKHAGKHPQTGQQLTWEFALDNDEVTIYWNEDMINHFSSNTKIQKIKCIETGMIYENATEAFKDTGIAACNILRVCKGQRKSAGKKHWEYVE